MDGWVIDYEDTIEDRLQMCRLLAGRTFLRAAESAGKVQTGKADHHLHFVDLHDSSPSQTAKLLQQGPYFTMRGSQRESAFRKQYRRADCDGGSLWLRLLHGNLQAPEKQQPPNNIHPNGR